MGTERDDEPLATELLRNEREQDNETLEELIERYSDD